MISFHLQSEKKTDDEYDVNLIVSHVRKVRFPTAQERIPNSFLPDNFWTAENVNDIVLPQVILDALDNW